MRPQSSFGLLLLISSVAVISALRYPSQNLNTDEQEANDGKSLAGRSAEHRIEKRQTQKTGDDVYFQPCQAPNGKPGHCWHLEDCLIPEFTKNYTQNTKHFCVIDQGNTLYAGVCCPDDQKRMTKSMDSAINSAELRGVQKEEPLCGVNGKRQDRIDSGESTDYTDWPWMVALMNYKSYKKTLVHFCGAVLISNLHVISAAHCFNKMKWQDTTVRIGAYDFQKTNDYPYTDYKVTAGKKHEDYDQATNENDIIILRLDRPVKFDKMIRPVCMPPPNFDMNIVNRTAVVAGWGAISFGGPPSSLLLQVAVPVWELETCKEQYTQPIQDSNVCASGYEGGKDACQGDSGGPLFFQRDDGKWMTIGVVSWGIGCAEKGRPGIYTRITSFLPWIAKAQKEMA